MSEFHIESRHRRVSADDCFAVAISLLESCFIIGVDLGPETQLGQAIKGLLWFGNHDKPALDPEMPAEDRRRAADAFLRYEQMSRLSAELELVRELPGVSEYRDVLRTGIDAFQDRSMPGLDRLAEISTAARVVKSSNFSSVRFDEPDVCATYESIPFGLAVKRIHSMTQVEKRVKSARKQIDRTGDPGIVVLDIEPLICRDRTIARNISYETTSLEGLGDLLSNQIQSFVEAKTKTFVSGLRDSVAVAGLVVYSQCTGLVRRVNEAGDSSLTWARTSWRLPLLGPHTGLGLAALDAVSEAMRHE